MSRLREQVAEFMTAMGQPMAPKPQNIPEDRVRLRAVLIAEECAETLGAMFSGDPVFKVVLDSLMAHIYNSHVNVDMVALADGLADLDYVVEGARLEFGIDGAPIADEVHRANMAKLGGPIAPNGKRLKPPGWTPPDIQGALLAQGWKP